VSPAPPRLLAVASASPAHRVSQSEVRSLVGGLFAELARSRPRLLEVFDHSGIEQRPFCMPLEWYARPRSFREQNAAYVEHALELGVRAARAALDRAGLAPRDVDHIVFVSSTGIATPSLDARISLALGCRPDCRRTPLWGLGCAGGVAGLARARDLAVAGPGSHVLLVAVELCSLTFRHGDRDLRNLVAASLFSDGASAAIVSAAGAPPAGGGALPGPALELVASNSTLWPDTLDVMGWEVGDEGLHVVFSRDIPTIVRERVRPCVEAFLASQGMSLAGISHLVAHPGGAKVLAAYASALDWPETGLTHARAVLREQGNLSSPSGLFVLERFLEARAFEPGQSGLLVALGPGFAAELLLLRAGRAA